LGVPVDTFVDPYRLVGEAQFNFRTKDVEPGIVAGFQERAGRWVATYRELANRLGEAPGPLGLKLQLTPQSSFEEAMAAGEALGKQWELGDVPAERLEPAIDRHLRTLVLYVDAPEGVSGAAAHLPRYDTILINRRESAARRYFDLAHELFHILTWDAMPPATVEGWEVRKSKGNRVEYLADNFAGALLMPSEVVTKRWGERGSGDVAAWLARTASELRVSGDALRWRLTNLKLLPAARAESLVVRPLRRGREREPRLFSRRFVGLVSRAVNEGRLSLRRAAGLLELSVADLGELCTAYGHPLTYDLAG
ncbi:MAG TPA: ImmA/IrrE family metallo-endopeptidase, partial [Longimicrobium sp.]|nr:ImmA/IrrE family metallo-endopeptidase [Longimicrobium sp.]